MATRPSRSQARLFAQLISELEPGIYRAFMASVVDLQSHVDWALLIERLQAFDIEGAINALNISPDAFATYASEMTAAYAKTGAATIAQIQALGIGGIGIRFSMSNPSAEEWIRRYVGESITGFTREAVEVARNVIAEGYAQGNGARTIGLDLVGRVDASGIRTGGIMGLDAPRAERLTKVTNGMRTKEGVRGLVTVHHDGSVSMKYKVNKATERRILAAYHAETAVPDRERLISERQYKNALLQARADTVASTEVGNAVMSARKESWEQAVGAEGLDASAVVKTWRHRRGEKNARPDHIAMNGAEVIGLDTPFLFPDGTEMQYAHDPAGGAKHTVFCGCDTEFRLLRKVA